MSDAIKQFDSINSTLVSESITFDICSKCINSHLATTLRIEEVSHTISIRLQCNNCGHAFGASLFIGPAAAYDFWKMIKSLKKRQ